MSGHFYLPFFLSFNTFLVAGGALSRRYPQLQRPLGLAGGLLIIAMGVAMPVLFPEQPAPAWFRWVIIACGAMIGLGAALNWLPITEDDTPLRPATGRPLRHFGETS